MPEISKKDGTQMGIIVDAHSLGKEPKLDVVNLKVGKQTAYDALEKTKIAKSYHPQFNSAQMAFVLSLDGDEPDQTAEGPRNWSFFTWNPTTKKWIVAKQGVSDTVVEDGTILGFSRTVWKKSGSAYAPKYEPRVSKDCDL